MKYPRGRGVAVTFTAVALVVSSAPAAWGAPGTQVNEVDTSVWTPPSPDPSGITLMPDGDFLLSDGEVDEMPIYDGANLFVTSPTGELKATRATLPWSNEPTGVAVDPRKGTIFVTDDDKKSVFIMDSLADTAPSSFKTTTFGNTDPEGVAYDAQRGHLLLLNGQTGAKFFRVEPGPDETFNGEAGGDVVTEYDLSGYGVQDPEGIAYDSARDTILVVDDSSATIYELAFNGSLLNTIDLSGLDTQALAGVEVAPASSGEGRNYYVVDRGLDNNSHPTENDGKVFEISANLPSVDNLPPAADAGADQLIDHGEAAVLAGTGSDPDPGDTLGYAWAKLTGPGDVSFTAGSGGSATASFSAAGTYLLRLTVTDTAGLSDFDDVTINVYEPGGVRTITIPIAASSDDAQQGGGSTGDFVEADSADNELGHNGAATPVSMVTGLRFTGIPVPQSGEIVSARIQFSVDEAGSEPASYTIKAEESDNAGTYIHGGGGDITSRTYAQTTVAWSPPAWTVIGEAGPAQQTEELKVLLQQIVNRPGWQEGNAAAFTFEGTGRRTAEAKDGLTPPVLMLQFKTVPLANAAPVVSAGTDQSVTLPAEATLAGTLLEDDAKPAAATLRWSLVSGPGEVTFGDETQPSTTAAFTLGGTYTLRLTATDGGLTHHDDVIITVTGNDTTTPPPGDGDGDGGGTTPPPGDGDGDGGGTTPPPGDGDGGGTTPPPSEPTNAAPVVKAGTDQTVKVSDTASLDATVTDDGQPAQLTSTWSKVSGPGTVGFGDVSQVDTTATFSAPGTYVLRLTANDGSFTTHDDVSVTVEAKDVTQPPPPTTDAPTLTAAVKHGYLRVGARTAVLGTVGPTAEGQPLHLQRRKGTTWRTVQRLTLSEASQTRYRFTVRSGRSGVHRFRVVALPYAGHDGAIAQRGLRIRVYRTRVVRVQPDGNEFVTIRNTGKVAVVLEGWTLTSRRTGQAVDMPAFRLRPRQAIRIRTGDGRSTRKDLYLGVGEMWEPHGAAVLRDGHSRLASRLRY